jgi:hypothetical protein
MEAQKLAAKEERIKQEKEKLDKGKVAPGEIFKSQTDLYSKFDEKVIL